MISPACLLSVNHYSYPSKLAVVPENKSALALGFPPVDLCLLSPAAFWGFFAAEVPFLSAPSPLLLPPLVYNVV